MRTAIIGLLLTLGSGAPAAPRSNVVPSRGCASSYTDATAMDGPQRLARNALFDKKSGEPSLSDVSAPLRLKYPASYERFAVDPITLADVAIIGSVTGGKSYLSNDKTTIYSETTFRVDVVLSNRSARAISTGMPLTAVRAGGVIRLPSGKLLARGAPDEAIPTVHGHYAILLKYVPPADVFSIVSGYWLHSNGRVYPLESITPDRSTFNDFGGSPDQLVSYLKQVLAK